MLRVILLLALPFGVDWILGAPAALAQTTEGELAGCRVYVAQTPEGVREVRKTETGEERYSILIGSPEHPAQIDCDEMQFFADRIEVYFDRHLVTAQGNIVFVSGGNRISADRMEFDTQTRTGTFYEASGIASLKETPEPGPFGTQEADAFFWGEQVQKIGPRKYRLVRGGFTTCVQPTPRWEISSGTVTLNLDDYALLTNSVFRVKGVPVFYLPVFYYPIQEDDRATGFLIPTYGTSTVRGQSISNAFFWAIGRSHDATLFHDWFSKAGQGFGGEYRYELGGGSQGSGRAYVLNESELTFSDSDGTEVTSPAKRSYQITGGLTQALPGSFHLRANADYFSDIVAQQRYQQNIHHATNRTRRFGANISGNWKGYVLSGTVERNDLFYSRDSMTTTGTLPRITFNRAERPIGSSRIYFGVRSEYVTLLRSVSEDDVETRNQGLTRLDVNPVLRIPFTRWPFLTVNSTVSWRGTYWTESLDPDRAQIEQGIGRRFFDLQARITGPVFNRIFDTPGGGYAERWKHVIEPAFTIQRVTAIDEFDRIVRLESADYIVGGVTKLTYGLNNRLYAKKTTAREILSATIAQTYYTDQRAAQFDDRYQSSFTGDRQSNFSAVRLQVRATPSDRFQGEFSTEWDPTVRTLTTFSADGTFSQGDWLRATAGWSQRRFIPDLPGFDRESLATHYLNASATLRGLRNRIGGTYAFNYDLRRNTFLQQRFMAYYNAQCCGFGVEYQTYNLRGSLVGIPVEQDRRFNVSFTLAGIGSFSNIFGAFGGQERR